MSTTTSENRSAFLIALATFALLFGLVPVGAGAATGPSLDSDTYNQWENGGNHAGQGWTNSNLDQQHNTWYENDVIPFRAPFTNMVAGESYTVTIQYDYQNKTEYAYDRLAPFDVTEQPDPCDGLPSAWGCTGGGDNSFDALGRFHIWNGTITNVGPDVDGTGSQKGARLVDVTFTANSDVVVLAWGGHIAWEGDWGDGHGAASIQGSPFHMRIYGVGTGGDLQVSANTVLPLVADPYVLKDASASTVAVDGTYDFLLVVGNNGPDAASDVTLTDTVPSVLGTVTNVSSTGGDCSASSGNDVSCHWDSIAAGLTDTVTVSMQAPANGAEVCDIPNDNTAFVSTSGSNSNVENDSDDASVTFTGCTADPYVLKDASALTVTVGGSYSFQIVVGNNGPDTATGVSLTDTVPSSMGTVTGVSPEQCSNDGNDVSCSFGSVTAGQTLTVTVSMTAPADGTDVCVQRTNTATVLTTGTNSNVQNDSDDASVTFTGCTADPYVRKSGPGAVPVGESYSFEIVVGNNGPDTATGVSLTDTVPGVMGTVTGVSPQQLCGTDGNLVGCSFGSIAAGQELTVTVSVDAPANGEGVCQERINTAQVTTTGSNSNVENDSDDATVRFTGCTADPYVQKSGPGAVAVGSSYSFQIVVGNNGPDTATGVSLTDTVPSSMGTVTGVSPEQCSNDGNDVSCSFGSVTAGQTLTVTVSMTAPADGTDVCVQRTNTATVLTTGTNSNVQNDSDDASVTFTGCTADPYVQKDASSSSVVVGGFYSFDVVVGNNGPDVATNVTMTDSVPASLGTVTGVSPAQLCSSDGNDVDCSFESIAQGTVQTVTISMQAPPFGQTDCNVPFTNQAQVSTTGSNSNLENDSDTAAVSFTGCGGELPPPSVNIEKLVSTDGTNFVDADAAPGPEVLEGDPVWFRVVVTNGNTTLVGIVLNDVVTSGSGPALDMSTCVHPSSMSPGGSFSCDFGPFPAQVGQHTDVASVSGSGNGEIASDSDPANYLGTQPPEVLPEVIEPTNPAIDLVKTALIEPDGDGFKSVTFSESSGGETITYQYDVTNTGDVTLTDIVLVDDILGEITLATTTLEPGESTVGTADYTVTEADALAGSVVNIAVVNGTDPDGNVVEDTDTETVDVIQVLPEVIDRPPQPEVEPEVLPRTGADSAALTAAAMLALVTGAAFVALSDRIRVRREDE